MPGGDDKHTTNEFESLLVEHKRLVCRFVRFLMPGYNAAEDVAQEVLVTAWKKRNEYAAGTNFKAWVFRIAKFHVLNQRRKLAHGNWLMFSDEVLDVFDPDEVTGEYDDSNDRRQALGECMGKLKPEEKELLSTRYGTKTSMKTYAEEKGVAAGTLKSRLFRLHEGLRKCIEVRLKRNT